MRKSSSCKRIRLDDGAVVKAELDGEIAKKLVKNAIDLLENSMDFHKRQLKELTMPNNIRNIVIFHGKDEDIEAVKKAIKGDNVIGKEVQCIDFDVIVPQPKGLLETEGWYGWRITRWGTKWNAYDSVPCNANELIFSTAWSCPLLIFEQLHEICGDKVAFEVKYADEDIGYNCGAFSFDKEGKHPGIMLQMGSEEAINFAKKVWDHGE